MDTARVVADTRRWLERAVIGLNLCPFAKAVHAKGQVHYAVSAATTWNAVTADLARELDDLVGRAATERETTLLMVPHCLQEFLEFNAFLAEGERLLAGRGLEGEIQLASFHPGYQFAGAPADDISNFTNRSPYPTLHLLREASIERAVQAFPQAETIYEANMQTMRRIGLAGWAALELGTLMKPAEPDIRPGQSTELLKELHILTRDGRMNQDSRRKLKQVYHLYQFIEKLLLELPDSAAGPTLADHGAGKSYLGFILYDLFLKPRVAGHVYGIETRPELVQRSRDLAARLGFGRMSFLNLSAADAADAAALPGRIDVVTALHACDTATDDAIAFGLRKQARFMVLVPCCQAEVAACLRQGKASSLARTPLAELWRHPLHTRELGSQLTNVLRCLYLEASGYQVTVTELVGWEHSMKNELILARYSGQPKRSAAERLRAVLAEFGLQGLEVLRYPGLS